MERPEAEKIDFHFEKCFAKIGRAGVNFFIDQVNFFSGCIDSI